MGLPFSRAQFFAVFESYNLAVWPAQALLLALAIVVLWWIVQQRPGNGRRIAASLAVLWVWMAMAYHFAFFAPINPAAWLFGAVFLLGSAAFVWVGVVRQQLDFGLRADARGWIGAVLIAFALLAYPALGWGLGHRFPQAPTFGLPCPTTIFSIGVLMFVRGPVPRSVLVVPFSWAVVGATAAFSLGVYQDLGLLVAGAVAAVALARRGVFRPTDSGLP